LLEHREVQQHAHQRAERVRLGAQREVPDARVRVTQQRQQHLNKVSGRGVPERARGVPERGDTTEVRVQGVLVQDSGGRGLQRHVLAQDAWVRGWQQPQRVHCLKAAERVALHEELDDAFRRGSR